MASSEGIGAPMSETEEAYLFEEDSELATKYAFNQAFGGKWMLFIGISYMDTMWTKSCRLYRQGQFPGIKSIKCSTAKVVPGQSRPYLGVIIFHCGPFYDSYNIQAYGRNIVEKLSYSSRLGFVSYKCDIQTVQGSNSTGKKINSLYKIPVPTSWIANRAG